MSKCRPSVCESRNEQGKVKRFTKHNLNGGVNLDVVFLDLFYISECGKMSLRRGFFLVNLILDVIISSVGTVP